MKNLSIAILIAFGFALPGFAVAQSVPADYAVQVEASVQESPPQITLHWNHDVRSQHFYVFRRLLGAGAPWVRLVTLPGADSLYTDNTALINTRYEYRVIDSTKTDSVYAAQGFVASGIDLQPQSTAGTIILVVDKTYATVLKKEIDQLVFDLTSEGRPVIRHDVNRTDAVTDIQMTIQTDQSNDPDHVRTVFLLGHVPVPYSGDIAPDGHYPGKGNHQGAWPADVYYGNFGTPWTDTDVNDTTGQDKRNWNVPGDGKFDQDTIFASSAPMDLEVGRVDLFGLPSFAGSDTVLMRQYLDRDHAFRTGQIQAPTRALVDDNFGIINDGIDRSYDVPAGSAWRNFPPLVGRHNIATPANTIGLDSSISKQLGWFGYMDTTQYLWAYGCGAGSWASCSGVGVTTQFAAAKKGALFYMVFGSFFGDWDRADAFTKAPIGTTFGLESCWAGRPAWFYHPLGIGETFGYCARLSQNVNGEGGYAGTGQNHIIFLSDYIYSPSLSGVHMGLMGDPTLRMQYLSDPPSALSASILTGNTVKLTWTAPSLSVPSYNIYRAKSVSDTLIKINTVPVTSTTFTDAAPMNDSNIYVIRAAALVTSPSGSWWDESGGVSASVKLQLAGVAQASTMATGLNIAQNGEFLDIQVSQESATAARLSIVDLSGREVMIVSDGALTPGAYNYRVSMTAYSSGVYFVRLLSDGAVQSAKIIWAR